MKVRVIIFFLFCLPVLAQASSDPGCKGKNKEACKKEPKVHSVEQFVFMIPGPSSSNANCDDHQALRSTVVNYYHWYLQNQDRIVSGLSRENKGKDLVPPFNISWKTLHEYFEFIQKKYAGWLPADAVSQMENPAGTAEVPLEKDAPGAIEDTLINSTSVHISNLAK